MSPATMLERWAKAAALFTVVFAVHAGVIVLGPLFEERPNEAHFLAESAFITACGPHVEPCPCTPRSLALEDDAVCAFACMVFSWISSWIDEPVLAGCWSDDGLCSDDELAAIVIGRPYRPPIRVRSVHVPDQR